MGAQLVVGGNQGTTVRIPTPTDILWPESLSSSYLIIRIELNFWTADKLLSDSLRGKPSLEVIGGVGIDARYRSLLGVGQVAESCSRDIAIEAQTMPSRYCASVFVSVLILRVPIFY